MVVAGFGLSACDKRNDPESDESILLRRAVQAMWGDVAPASVKTFHVKSTVRHGDSSYHIETWVQDRNHYRSVREGYGIRQTEGIADDEVWADVDGTVVPIDDAMAARIRLQPWLFQVSKLEPLEDADEFNLEYLGKSKRDDGREVEQLRAKSRTDPSRIVTFDFRADDHLVHRVALEDRSTKEVLSLLLSDYRNVDGVRIAHHLECRRGDKLYAEESVESVTVNDDLTKDFFMPPPPREGESKPRKIIEKPSVSGLVAFAPHDGPLGEMRETVEKLKDWIDELGHDVTGPLIVLHSQAPTASRPTGYGRTVCIPVDAKDTATGATPRTGFGFRRLEARTAMCATIAGETSSIEVIRDIVSHASAAGKRPAGPVVEVHFSADGTTRQVQLPVE